VTVQVTRFVSAILPLPFFFRLFVSIEEGAEVEDQAGRNARRAIRPQSVPGTGR
jgi:hypothetical protein